MIKLIIAGDYCMHDRMQQYSSSEIVAAMSSVLPHIQESDYAIVNLECAVFDGEHQPIVKDGPNLHNSFESVKALKALGFNGVTLANNHFADYGPEAVNETLSLLKHNKIDYFGGGENIQEASQIKYIELHNKKIAIINACEHEFTIATDTEGGANPLDVIDMSHAIKEAAAKADYTIVIIHGGSEHYELPTPRMQKWYRFFVEMGADAVINHHQHCYSGDEIYEGKPIIYGLGNFCLDWNGKRHSKWNEGYMIQLQFNKTVGIKLIPYIQCDAVVGTFITNDRKTFDKHVGDLNAIIADKEQLEQRYVEFVKAKTEDYLYVFHNPQNRTLRRMANKGILPNKFASEVLPQPMYKDQNKLLTLLNTMQCESHRDVMRKVLTELNCEL